MKETHLLKRFGITDEQFWGMIEQEEYPCDCRLWLGKWTPAGYGVLHFDKSGVLANTIYRYAAYQLVFEKFHRRQRYDKMHIGHLCGLAPCCNPLHLMLITRSQNSKDGLLHKHIFEAIGEHQRQELRESGMGFKEIARTLDIPAGVAFRVLYGKPNRENYPAPFIDDRFIQRQPKAWAVGRYDEEMILENITGKRVPRAAPEVEKDDLWFWD